MTHVISEQALFESISETSNLSFFVRIVLAVLKTGLTLDTSWCLTAMLQQAGK